MFEFQLSQLPSKTLTWLRTESLGRPNLLWAIMALAFILRVIEITEDSIWIDEAFAIMAARLDFEPMLARIFADGLTPPLHYLILSVWIQIFGDSELSTRSLSLLFGVVSVWLIYELAALLAGRRVALLSTLILALSSFHVHYAQEARTYTLLLCLSIASYLFFCKILQHDGKRNVVFYLLTSSLMIYAHFFGVFVVLAQNIHFAFLCLFDDRRAKDRFWRWCFVQTILILSVTPLAYLLMGGLQRVNNGVWIADTFPPNLQSLLALLSAFSGSIIGLLFFIFLFVSVLWVWNRRRPWPAALKELIVSPVGLLVGWLVVGIGAPFVISLIAQPILFPRYSIYASVPLFILVALSIEVFQDKVSIYSGLLATLVVLACVQMVGFYAWNWNHFRFLRDWRSAQEYVERSAAPNHLVLCTGNCQGLGYYLRNTDLKLRLSPPGMTDDQNRGPLIAKLMSDMKAYDRIYYVRPRRIADAIHVTDALESEFSQGKRKKVKGLFIDVFERKTPED